MNSFQDRHGHSLQIYEGWNLIYGCDFNAALSFNSKTDASMSYVCSNIFDVFRCSSAGNGLELLKFGLGVLYFECASIISSGSSAHMQLFCAPLSLRQTPQQHQKHQKKQNIKECSTTIIISL